MALLAGSFVYGARRAGSEVVLCWGNNNYGQLGDGTISTRLNPTLVPGFP